MCKNNKKQCKERVKTYKKYLKNVYLLFRNETSKAKTKVEFSMKNLNKDDNLINISPFMVEYIKKLIDFN